MPLQCYICLCCGCRHGGRDKKPSNKNTGRRLTPIKIEKGTNSQDQMLSIWEFVLFFLTYSRRNVLEIEQQVLLGLILDMKISWNTIKGLSILLFEKKVDSKTDLHLHFKNLRLSQTCQDRMLSIWDFVWFFLIYSRRNVLEIEKEVLLSLILQLQIAWKR